jgi:nucleotide-binding universal stress UspA family protein
MEAQGMDRAFERVLVALDGSAEAETVLPFLLQLVGPLDVDIVLFHALGEAPGHRGIGEANEYLAARARELEGTGVRVRTRVGHGEPVGAILAAARAEHVDLIVMTTHGRTGLRRAVTGSVAQAVVRQAEVPVLLLCPTAGQITRRAERPR